MLGFPWKAPMQHPNEEPKLQNPMQTEAARAAAHATRNAREALKVVNRHRLMVYAVRLSGSAFGWELRHLGGIVHHRSTEGFPSMELAREAGEAALAALPDASA